MTADNIKFVNSMPGLRNLGLRGIIQRRIGIFGRILELVAMAKDNPQIIGHPFSKVYFDSFVFLPHSFFPHNFAEY